MFFKTFTSNIDGGVKIENCCIVDKIYVSRRIQSIVHNPICSENKIKTGSIDWKGSLKSQVDYQVSESFDWYNKELFLFL